MNHLLARLAAILITAAAAVTLGAATVDATPGRYTHGGDVRVYVAVSDGYCATVTWPKGYTSTTCDVDSTTQDAIVPGDKFGATITSYSGGGVACSVVDVDSGDTIYEDSASSYDTADCLRNAV